MTGKLKELMGAAQIRRCVLCGGEKEIAVPNKEIHRDFQLPSHVYQKCHACCGIGYQGYNHQPATAEQMTLYAELVAKYAIEQHEAHTKIQRRAREQDQLVEGMKKGERVLREMLAHASCPFPYLYYDDGELQDSRVHPHIDYLRDTPFDIHNKLIKRSADAMAKIPKEEIEAALKGALCPAESSKT